MNPKRKTLPLPSGPPCHGSRWVVYAPGLDFENPDPQDGGFHAIVYFPGDAEHDARAFMRIAASLGHDDLEIELVDFDKIETERTA